MSDRLPTHAELLRSFNARCDVLRDCARGVALHYQTGCFVTGRSGTSKTVSITAELDRLGVPWLIPKGRVTGPSLFDIFHDTPNHTIVFDDLTNLYNSGSSIGVQLLMAATDGDPKQARLLTYQTRGDVQRCWFAGGVILIGNVPLKRDPLANALRSRCRIYEHDPTDEEVAAFMRHLASKGFEELSPDKCREVAEYLISASMSFIGRVDLRYFGRSLSYRQQWEHGNATTHWQQSIDFDLANPARESRTETKDDQKTKELFRVRRAIEDHPGDRNAQVAASGLSRAGFYRRFKALVEAGLLLEDEGKPPQGPAAA